MAELPAGANTLTGSACVFPGAWTLKLDAKAGQRFRNKNSLRKTSIGGGMLGPIGGMIDASQNANAGGIPVAGVGKRGDVRVA